MIGSVSVSVGFREKNAVSVLYTTQLKSGMAANANTIPVSLSTDNVHDVIVRKRQRKREGVADHSERAERERGSGGARSRGRGPGGGSRGRSPLKLKSFLYIFIQKLAKI